jgi:hypothetical protein
MYRQLVDELPILTSSVVVRRAVLDETTWYAERVVLFEDWEFFARVARKSNVGYVTTPTTVNVGHLDPGRVSKCSSLDRADAYRTLLERVWLADQAFLDATPTTIHDAYGRALLVVAREALLAGRTEHAMAALATRRTLGMADRRGWTTFYGLCARIGGGRLLLRGALRGRTLLSLLVGTGRRVSPVNPAA